MEKPIISYVIKIVIKSDLFDEVIVSTDDEEIAKIALSYGAKVPFLRSKKNSNDYATTVDVLIEVLDTYLKQNEFFNMGLCIYPTAALVSQKDLNITFDKFLNGNFDSLIPIIKYPHPIQRALKISDEGKLSYVFKDFEKSRTQDLDKTDKILKKKSLIMNNTGYWLVSNENFQDIDNLDDWKKAEVKYKKNKK